MFKLAEQIAKRRTFAIISHPDAGKTTLTEKLLLFGGAIQLAGSIKGRKAGRHAVSDWMELEKQRGISITTSVMQFIYRDHVINLLDTPGHADFTEDTYRTLTAVDSALMVIDAAKGVEPRTIKLMQVCRLRTTPIITFINKLDRESQDPIELLDNIESVLDIRCAPVTWPIGTGKQFKGIYHLNDDAVYFYEPGRNYVKGHIKKVPGLDNPKLDQLLGDDALLLRNDINLLKGASHAFNKKDYLAGRLTPVFFGSAINTFGVCELLDNFIKYAPEPQPRRAKQRWVSPDEPIFSGFVFKIQANMDPAHRDRIAFLRIVSGQYKKGMRIRHHRLNKDIVLNNVLTFMAGGREQADRAWPGDIIGLHNHGTIQIGDVLSSSEVLKFTGIPNFAPELFRLVCLRDPLRRKALLKGLMQLSEEGATQVFRPLHNNDLILGAVGILQFDVVAYRLKNEYGVECAYKSVPTIAARWITCDDKKVLERFKEINGHHLAVDSGDNLTYLAPSRVNLEITTEQWKEINFHDTQEH